MGAGVVAQIEKNLLPLRDPAAKYFLNGCALPGLHSQPLVSQEGSLFALISS